MASPPGAVPPPEDGEPDLPPGIAPPPEPGVSANASASDLGAANVAGWAGSADAHAAAWAAYQQQYAYQHAGGDWAAYHAAWANEWVRHNEAAAAAAAAPSAEQLAAVAAKIAEQITEAEKNETRPVAPASATADVTTRPATLRRPEECGFALLSELLKIRSAVGDTSYSFSFGQPKTYAEWKSDRLPPGKRNSTFTKSQR